MQPLGQRRPVLTRSARRRAQRDQQQDPYNFAAYASQRFLPEPSAIEDSQVDGDVDGFEDDKDRPGMPNDNLTQRSDSESQHAPSSRREDAISLGPGTIARSDNSSPIANVHMSGATDMSTRNKIQSRAARLRGANLLNNFSAV